MPQHTPQEDEPGPQDHPSIRTYKSDVEEYMKKEGTTLADITAEELKRNSTRTFFEKPARRNIRPLAAGLAVLLVAGTAVAAVFWRKSGKTEMPVPAAAEPLIRPDRTETIVFSEGDHGDFLSRYQAFLKTPLPENELVFIAPIARAADGASHTINARDFFSLLSVAPPDEFLRGLEGRFMLGVLPVDGRNHIALIFTVLQAEYAIAGAFRWEPAMLADLRALYSPRINTGTGINTFEDGVAQNNDIRLLRNIAGDPVLVYSIFNRNFFIITSSPAGFEHLIRRIGGLPPP